MNNAFGMARDIFIQNYGCRELMKDNQCLEEYEQFKVPKEIEYVWKDEFIEEQFLEASTSDTKISNLISSVCLIAGYYGNYLDYKKIFSIKDKFLIGSDILIYIMYLEKVFDSITTLITNNDVSQQVKFEIICEFEDMLIEIINGKDNIPDNHYNYVTQKYGLKKEENYTSTRLKKFYDEVKELKEWILNSI